jgi:hypothetical protein
MARRERRIRLPLQFDEALADLLKVKPPEKPAKSRAKKRRARNRATKAR